MDFKDIISTQIKPCIEQFIEKRQSLRVVGENLDLVYEISNWSVVISEIKELPWYLGKIQLHKVRMTYDTRHFHWKLYYWEDKKWASYSDEDFTDFSDVIKVVEDDVRGCFFK